MNKINLCLIIGIVILCIVILYLYINQNTETFETDTYISSGHPDISLRDIGQKIAERFSTSNNQINQNSQLEMDTNEYIKRTDLERVARASTREYCPVNPNYNPDDYIKKTEIDYTSKCPVMPDLKDYVLKSTIPPIQKCPSCICPKVKVSAGMCKKCPEVKNNCPQPKPCNAEQCKGVINCPAYPATPTCPILDKSLCPSPQPCPKPPVKVCPSLVLDKPSYKCPSPKPCPVEGHNDLSSIGHVGVAGYAGQLITPLHCSALHGLG